MMKRILTTILIICLIISGCTVVYNFVDKYYNYRQLLKQNNSLNVEYNNLKKTIDDYNKKIKNEEIADDDLIDTIATDEREIEITDSDIDRFLQGQQSSDDALKKAYLTFDDGPSKITAKILDVLAKYNIKATFFVNGKEDEYSKSLYKRIVNEGHSIGNHTYVHSYRQVYASMNAFTTDFNKLQDTVKAVTGITMNIMRFPGGSNNTVSNNYCRGIMAELTEYYKHLGIQYFDWNVSAGDSRSRRVSTKTIVRNVLRGSKGKSTIIILMHDSRNKKRTLAALPTIIKSLQSLGYTFLSLNVTSPNVQFK